MFDIEITPNVIMYTLIVLVIGYIIFSVFGSMNVVEGLKNADKTPALAKASEMDSKKQKKIIDKMHDVLLISKYRGDYEDTLTNLEELINQTILQNLIFASTQVNDTGVTLDDKIVSRINNLYKLRDNLVTTMDFIDSKKDASSSISSIF